jgi:hypothetical protein
MIELFLLPTLWQPKILDHHSCGDRNFLVTNCVMTKNNLVAMQLKNLVIIGLAIESLPHEW